MPKNANDKTGPPAARLRRLVQPTEDRLQLSQDRILEGYDRLFTIRDAVVERTITRTIDG